MDGINSSRTLAMGDIDNPPWDSRAKRQANNDLQCCGSQMQGRPHDKLLRCYISRVLPASQQSRRDVLDVRKIKRVHTAMVASPGMVNSSSMGTIACRYTAVSFNLETMIYITSASDHIPHVPADVVSGLLRNNGIRRKHSTAQRVCKVLCICSCTTLGILTAFLHPCQRLIKRGVGVPITGVVSGVDALLSNVLARGYQS